MKLFRLAVVVPVYGNEPTLRVLHRRIVDATAEMPVELTVQYVNDRSPDNSQAVLEDLAASDPRVRVIMLSRNHGSFVAITAGMNEVLDHDAVFILSADLQDPPETIREMFAKWREGFKVVLGVRRSRVDPFLSRCLSTAFNWIFRKVVMSQMPTGGFDMCLIDRQVAEVLLQSSEKQSSLVGLILWCGFERALVYFDRAKRPVGRSMWTFSRKLDYAVNSIVSFSALPLKGLLVMGSVLTAASIAYSLVVLAMWCFGGLSQPGWASLMVVLLIVLATTMVGFGVIGAYLGNALEQVRKRPLFIVDKRIGVRSFVESPRQEISFFDPAVISDPVKMSLSESAQRVIASNTLILGPEVALFERHFADAFDLGHVVGVANGTDAITLALWALDIPQGSLVAVPAISAPATAVAVLRAGMLPVFVDVTPDCLVMCPEALKRVLPLGVKAIVPVHLYGNSCDLDSIAALAGKAGIPIVEDCAQSVGSSRAGKYLGSLTEAAAFSFYPSKNLGAYGDGGAVAVRDPVLAARLKRMRFYGQNQGGECIEQGMNSRLDELQAALLSERLKVLSAHNRERARISGFYDGSLQALSPVPSVPGRVAHLYVIRPDNREDLQRELSAAGIGWGVHYRLPLNKHKYLVQNGVDTECPVAENACKRVLSLPCHPGLAQSSLDRIVEVCCRWAERG